MEVFPELCSIHILTVFHHGAAEAVKYYITNTSKKQSRYPVQQFFVHMKQLNNYLETSKFAQQTKGKLSTKQVLPLDDDDLVTHFLQMRLAK